MSLSTFAADLEADSSTSECVTAIPNIETDINKHGLTEVSIYLLCIFNIYSIYYSKE
jgi:hypothetical protein